MEPVPGNSWITRCRSVLRYWEINRAVAFLVASRGWQFVSGFITLFLLTRNLPGEAIGVYSAFANQLGVQLFAELGLPGIVVVLASHEWAHLQLDPQRRIDGNAQCQMRLAGLLRFADRWFWMAGVLFVLIAGGLGTWNLEYSDTGTVDWRWPWICSVLSSALCFPYIPRIALLEGCNQVDRVNLLRLYQSIAGSLMVWLVLVSGAGLWALVGSNIVRWGCETWLVHVHYRATFQSLREVAVHEPMSWRQEIWPLQWRFAIQSVGSYFSTYFFQPLILRVRGGVVAGQFGMTWQVLNTLYTVSYSWVNTRTAELGGLASRGEHGLLHRRLRKIGWISVGVFLIGSLCFGLTVEALRQAGVPMGSNFLPHREVAVLVLGMTGILVATLWQLRVRLYKHDPFLIPNTLAAISMSCLAWFGIQKEGSWGLAIGYAGLVWIFTVPISFWVMRNTITVTAHRTD